MGVTNTTNYNLIKPNPGEERDAWGPYLNTNMDTIDAQIKARADAITALQSGKQDVDADLTAIAALAGTSGLLKKTSANAWTLDTTSYSPVGHSHVIGDVTGLQSALDGKQPLDADLTAIAALTPGADSFIVGNGSTWTAESPSQARTSLGLGGLAVLSAVGATEITDGSVGTGELGDASVTTAKIANAAITTAKIADGNVTAGKLAAGVGMPSGAVMPFAGSSEPAGWLFCFGQNVSRTTYAALFAAIGTTFGVGDGSTTFTLPDLRGRAVAGKDDMGGTSANRLTNQAGGLDGDVLGATGGAETHTLTEAQMPLHGHPFRLTIQSASTASSSTTGGLMMGSTSLTNYPAFTGTPANTAGQQIGGAGGGGAHNNVQPSIVLNYIIKV